MDDQQFRQLLNRFDFSWSGYRKIRKGVKKRIRRHMMALGCLNISDYLTKIDNNGDVKRQCELLLTVSISRFFRDLKLWEILENELLPKKINKNSDSIKIWSAGCASGEEVYSFKITWDRVIKHAVNPPTLDIIGTDMNPTYLARARAGVYSASSLKEATATIKHKYFQHEPGKNLYRVNPYLKKGILWHNHNLLSDPPGSDFDIIFLRNNILTYYKDGLKNVAFNTVLTGLSSDGLLIIGSHESLPSDLPDLTPITQLPYVFRKEVMP
jgi:chemotaxis methyl-accepting protein methylase